MELSTTIEVKSSVIHNVDLQAVYLNGKCKLDGTNKRITIQGRTSLLISNFVLEYVTMGDDKGSISVNYNLYDNVTNCNPIPNKDVAIFLESKLLYCPDSETDILRRRVVIATDFSNLESSHLCCFYSI